MRFIKILLKVCIMNKKSRPTTILNSSFLKESVVLRESSTERLPLPLGSLLLLSDVILRASQHPLPDLPVRLERRRQTA